MDHLTLSERVTRLENFAGLERGSFVTEQHFEEAWTQPNPKKPDQTAFEEIIQCISSCNDRVCLTADKLQRIGDRIMGAIPEATDEMATGIQSSPGGTLDNTFMALNLLDASLYRLEQVALRMERV